MDIVRFANPKLLWLLTLVVPMTAYYVYRLRQGRATMRISTVSGLRGVPRGARYYLRHMPFVLRCGAVALLVVALARPQSSQSDSSRTTEGIDIVLSLDISGSMLARDFQPDRISAAKEVAASFIADRPNDRIGLVVFAGESFTQSPLTTDKASLLNILGTVRSGMIDDGTAADIASTLGIRVYTIGVGSEGQAPYPALDMWGNLSFVPMKVEIDEKILSDIAEKTGGRYFRATDNEKLREIYKEINRLEKSRVEVESQTRYDERFAPFVLGALLLLAAGFAMRRLWFRQIP